MQLPINRPTVLATQAVAFNDITITACPDPATTGGPNTGNLVINDAAALADANDGNVLWSCPFAALFENCLHRGPVAGSGTTSVGLVVSEVPPGAAAIIRYGE
jgi:hypothetical protein